jgi:hypothetical protein
VGLSRVKKTKIVNYYRAFFFSTQFHARLCCKSTEMVVMMMMILSEENLSLILHYEMSYYFRDGENGC